MTTPKVLNKRKHGIPEGAVYVGRPTLFGNPFMIGPDGDRDTCIEKFRQLVDSSPVMRVSIKAELKGKDLVCWCAPKPCHADILLKVANS
jgi:hypothetical protein